MRLFAPLINLLNKRKILVFSALILMNTLAAQPTITSVTPTSATVGSTVVIKGTNFSATPLNNIVYFGPVKAIVNSASAASLSVTVPVGSGNEPITVTTNNSTVYTAYPFRIIAGSTLTVNSFSIRNDFTGVGTYPSGLGEADFNGDGKTDLVSTGWNSANVSILKNTSTSGTVSFDNAIQLSTGTHPDAAATGDLNSDGKPDLVVTSTDNHWFCVFINTSTAGTISFATGVNIAGGLNTGPRGVVLYDMDGDGRTDVIIPNNEKTIDFSNNTSYGTVSVYRNTGSTGTSVSFAAPALLKMVDYPRKITAGDIDGDGKPDLVIASQVMNDVYVFRNKSTPGNLSFDPYLVFTTGINTEQSALGDLDNDGRLDLVVTNLTSSNVAVLRNTSSPGIISFAAKQDLPGVSPLGLAIGDLDGDDRPDIAVANYGLNKVSIWKNTSVTGNLSFAPRMDYYPGSGPVEVFIGDIDGDGEPDLSLTNSVDNKLTVLRTVAAPPTLNLGKDTTLCEGDSVLLNAFKPAAQYQWSTGASSPSLLVKNTGTYWLKLTVGGYTLFDTINITFNQSPVVSLGADVSVCDNEKTVLHAGVTNAVYLWQDGSVTESINVKNAGLYWVEVGKGGCVARDSVMINLKPSPVVNLGGDTTICSGAFITLNAFQNNITGYSWQDGSSGPAITIQHGATCWVTIKAANGCSGSDTIKVSIKKPPTISWDGDTVMCKDPLWVKPTITDGSYLWQNGSTDSSFKVTAPGNYALKAINECGVATKTITITKGLCDLMMPNAFTPNSDGNNDIFRVKYAQFIKQFKMQVFNRWGQMVYYGTDPHGGWNGNCNGTPQATGNYLWVISVIDKQGRSAVYTGSVLLIR